MRITGFISKSQRSDTMSDNIGFITKKRIAKEIATLYNEHNEHILYDMGACNVLNNLCKKLNIKPMHINKHNGGTGEMLNP